jgi:Bifunctional DNA primase/polymerase, N-terminal
MRFRDKKHSRSHWQRIQRQARICADRQWSVLPIRAGSKAPRTKEWTELRLRKKDLEDAFNETDNIGVLLGEASDGLVDIDLDSAEAIRAAKYYLPETDRIHGRRTKLSSHFWYRVRPTLAPAKFSDPDGTVILECRGDLGIHLSCCQNTKYQG